MPTARKQVHRDIHPDDGQHRRDLQAALVRLRKATGMNGRAMNEKYGMAVFVNEKKSQWHVGTVQRWAHALGRQLTWRIEGFSLPDEMVNTFDWSASHEDQRAELKARIKEVRRALKIPTTRVDKVCQQRACTYWAWEKKGPGDLVMPAVQRHIRAMGGRIEFQLRPIHNEFLGGGKLDKV